MIKFIYDMNHRQIEFTVKGDSPTWEDLLRDFADFLKSIGYFVEVDIDNRFQKTTEFWQEETIKELKELGYKIKEPKA